MYLIDVEGGNTTLLVAPSGESARRGEASAPDDGSFTVTPARNGFSKTGAATARR
jgi:hypothetical protein